MENYSKSSGRRKTLIREKTFRFLDFSSLAVTHKSFAKVYSCTGHSVPLRWSRMFVYFIRRTL